MSFIGAVASSVRQVLAQYADKIEHPVLLIGAGNFTVASALRSGGYNGKISACDVSLYTSALGAYLSDQPFTISEKSDCPEQLRGFLRMETPLDIIASIALLYDLREVWQLKNPFQERVVTQYRLKWDDLLSATKTKLVTYKKHLGKIEYHALDGFDLLKNSAPEHTVIVFPPTYKAGYQRLEKLLRAALDWKQPPYLEMTDKSIELYREINRFSSYFVVLEKNLPEVQEILGEPSAILPRGRNSFSHILTSNPLPKMVFRKVVKSQDIGPFWPADRKITGKETPSIAKITFAQSIRMNELFLSSRIDYFTGGVGVSVAFLLDGHVIGKADFCPSSHQWKLPNDQPMIYLMSDLAVPSAEKRLAKLVLLCLLSREIKETLDLRYVEDFSWVATTAFSTSPASMKYRGIFKLHKRKETEGGFLLNYYAGFGEHTISQVLDIWLKKYNKK